MVLLVVIAVLPLVLIYVYCLSKSVLFGWISLLVFELYLHMFGTDTLIFGTINIDPVDIIEMCLLAAGVIRTIPRLRRRDTARSYSLVYLSIFAFSVIRGIAAGRPHVGNDSRSFVPFLIACLYFFTAPVDSVAVRKYVRAFLMFGLGLELVAILATAGLKVGEVAYGHNDPSITASVVDRVLPADAALALALCFYFALTKSSQRKDATIYKIFAAAFLGMAVYLRHRTVWAVLVAGLLYLLIKDRTTFRRLVPLGVVACLVIGTYVLVTGSAAQGFGTKLSDSATNNETWLWRLGGWLDLLGNEQATATNVLFGKSLGGGYIRLDPISLVYIDTIPHSEYVSQFYNLGLAGLAVVLYFMIRPVRRFSKLSSSDMFAVEPSASAWAIVAIGIITYSVAYNPPVEAYALLGIANAMVSRLDNSAQRMITVTSLAQAG